MKIRMKSYIKPFEKVLAVMELERMAGIDNLQVQDGSLYDIETDTSQEELQNNLAYWEAVGEDKFQSTRQVLLENTYRGEEPYGQLELFGETGGSTRQTRVLRYGLHDIHEYRGKFFPQLVRACINISGIKPGSIVFDPFCGSGTTLCESRVRGMKSLGIDLNPLSVMISRVKTGMLGVGKEELLREYHSLQRRIVPDNIDYSDRWDEADKKYLTGWFAEEALQDIHKILCAVECVKNLVIADFFRLNLSNIIREISWQKQSDLRVRKEIGEYHRGTAITRFQEEAQRQFTKINAYLDLVGSLDLQDCEIIEGNTVQAVESAENYLGRCDVLITSPPYATALPYLDTDRLSLVILGLMHRRDFPGKNIDMVGNREITEKQRRALWENYEKRRSELTDEICAVTDQIADENHKPEVGFRRRNLPALLAKYFLDMLDSMRAADKMLKPGALAFYVVGNNSTNLAGKKMIIETNVLLWDLAEKIGWEKENYIDMDMLKAKKGFRNNPGTAEAILIFRKRGQR